MFCPECGKKNLSEAKFCEHCGAKIVDDTKVIKEKKPKKDKKPMSKKNKIIISIIIVLCVTLTIVGLILSNNYKPSKVALEYFTALMENDTDKLYDYISVPENEFTTKEMFKKVNDDNDDDDDLLNYKVTSEKISNDGLTAEVEISYTKEDDKTTSTKTIYLVKDKKNKLLIFDNWKISNQSSMINEDYTITTIKDATLKLEGVTVDKKYKENSSYNYDTYVIPALFKGTYDVTISLKNGLTTKTTINVNNSYSSNINDLELSDEDEDNLENTIKDNINTLYKAAIEKKTFDDVKTSFEYDDADLSDLESSYNSFSNSINGLIEYNVDEVEIEDISINSDGYLYVQTKISYKYTAEKYIQDETVSKEDNDIAYLTFDYADGFKLVDMLGLTTYFSRY